MSTALAIGATMRCLASLVDTAVKAASISTALGGLATTTVLAPDRNEIGTKEVSHLNLFLYAVTMNAGWRTIERMRDTDGKRVGKPPLAVDLHVMMSAYGHVDYDAEMLLGIGMQALYEQSFLDRGQIAALFAGAVTDQEKALATALLDQQIEQIKIAEHDLSADELYKLWSAFGSKCRPSAAYVATVVLIESRVEISSAPPVLERNLDVLTLARIRIDDIVPATFTVSLAGTQVTLRGQGLNLPGNAVALGDSIVPFDSATPAAAKVTVPPSVPPSVNLLRVVRQTAAGVPPDKTIGTSNQIAFVVQPAISNIAKVVLRGKAGISVDVQPAARREQKVTLLLSRPAHNYAIDALPEDNGGTTVEFATPDVLAGSYLVRVRVDGTESVPAFDPVAGFTGPLVLV